MKLPLPSFSLAGYALTAGLALGSLAGWRITSWVNQGQELKAVKTALQNQKAAYDKRISDLQGQVKTNQEASLGYQNELATLRAQPRDPRPVRLCVGSPNPRLPQAAATEPGPARPAPAPGGISPQDGRPSGEGPDIAADLYGLADRCDEISAQLRGLQQSVLGR